MPTGQISKLRTRAVQTFLEMLSIRTHEMCLRDRPDITMPKVGGNILCFVLQPRRVESANSKSGTSIIRGNRPRISGLTDANGTESKNQDEKAHPYPKTTSRRCSVAHSHLPLANKPRLSWAPGAKIGQEARNQKAHHPHRPTKPPMPS